MAFNIGVELGPTSGAGNPGPGSRRIVSLRNDRTRGYDRSVGDRRAYGMALMTERFGILSQYSFPGIDAVSLATLLRWLTAIVFVAGVIWLISALQKQRAAPSD